MIMQQSQSQYWRKKFLQSKRKKQCLLRTKLSLNLSLQMRQWTRKMMIHSLQHWMTMNSVLVTKKLSLYQFQHQSQRRRYMFQQLHHVQNQSEVTMIHQKEQLLPRLNHVHQPKLILPHPCEHHLEQHHVESHLVISIYNFMNNHMLNKKRVDCVVKRLRTNYRDEQMKEMVSTFLEAVHVC